MFSREIIEEITSAAKALGIEPAALLAIAEVESGGSAYARIDGRDEPLIRFEGHYFDRRLSAEKQAKARALGLSAPVAGAVPNPRTQEARWRMLARAEKIDRKAAYESVSWGLGQVMGAHWAWLGYADVETLAAEARAGAAGQVRLMARYIDKAGLTSSLRDHDWTAFARGYNGPDYRKNAYHTRLAAAYERYRALAPTLVETVGTRNPAARDLLVRGFAGPAAATAPPVRRPLEWREAPVRAIVTQWLRDLCGRVC